MIEPLDSNLPQSREIKCPLCGNVVDTNDATQYEVNVSYPGGIIHKKCPPITYTTQIHNHLAEELNTPLVTTKDAKINREPPVSVIGGPAKLNELIDPPKAKDISKVLPSLMQQETICLIAYSLSVQGLAINEQSIRDHWSQDYREWNRVGKPPHVTSIAEFMATDNYIKMMRVHGVNVNKNELGLTQQQEACLSMIADVSSKKSIGTILRLLKIKQSVYQGWLTQPAFNDALRKMTSSTLKNSIPLAEAQLAAKAAAGDLPTIKFMFEVTGRHDPARQQQVDTQALIGVIIDVLQETIIPDNVENMTAPELLAHIHQQIKFKAQGVKGVITQ